MMDIEEARQRLAANPPQGDPTAEPGETLAEKAARLAIPTPQFARPFNVTTAEGELYHCVEFPTTGLVVLASPVEGLMSAYTSVEILLAEPAMQGATVERPEDADLADFRQWLIDNGGAMRLALNTADLTDAEVEARLAAAHAQAEQRTAGEAT